MFKLVPSPQVCIRLTHISMGCPCTKLCCPWLLLQIFPAVSSMGRFSYSHLGNSNSFEASCNSNGLEPKGAKGPKLVNIAK